MLERKRPTRRVDPGGGRMRMLLDDRCLAQGSGGGAEAPTSSASASFSSLLPAVWPTLSEEYRT